MTKDRPVSTDLEADLPISTLFLWGNDPDMPHGARESREHLAGQGILIVPIV
jgi:hypothetical protein